MDAKERLLNDLKGIVTGKRVANAYLLTGGTAEDRMELGEAFARMLVTTEADIIRPEIEKKDQKTLLFSVGDVRRGITDTVYVRPYGDGKKVYLLDKAAYMNVEAENALLKTLEEPPEYAVLILLAPNENTFLPTVLSRCVRLPLPEVKEEGLTSEESREIRDSIVTLLSRTRDIHTDEILSTVKGFGKNRKAADLIAETVRSWFRDALILKKGGALSLIGNQAAADAIRETANDFSFDEIEDVLQKTELAKRRTEANVNFDLNYTELFSEIAKRYKEAR